MGVLLPAIAVAIAGAARRRSMQAGGADALQQHAADIGDPSDIVTLLAGPGRRQLAAFWLVIGSGVLVLASMVVAICVMFLSAMKGSA